MSKDDNRRASLIFYSGCLMSTTNQLWNLATNILQDAETRVEAKEIVEKQQEIWVGMLIAAGGPGFAREIVNQYGIGSEKVTNLLERAGK